MSNKYVIGFTMGDPNGIGPEVLIKSLEDKRLMELFTPVIFGSGKLLSFTKKLLGKSEFNFHITDKADQIRQGKVNLVNCWPEEFKVNYGTIEKEAGRFALASLKACVEAAKEGNIDAIVTAPISKFAIQSDEFKFSGHTEYLAEHFSKDKENLMILANGDLRIALCTGHIPIKDISSKLSWELIEKKASLFAKSLRTDFGIRKPRIAILALNPHAGDSGALGKEEIEIISPAIVNLQKESKSIFQGPFAADGFFGEGGHLNYDGILAMYHDQGLAPFKALSFGNGVNFSAGMSIVRTSPDHGTAMNIAGKGIADAHSMREAIYFALDRLKVREGENELKKEAVEI